MNDSEEPWRGAATAALSWDEQGSPHSEQFSDLYYSSADGLEESRQVFLAGNELPERWQDLHESDFTILETGFGTGLNFLATWEAWRASETGQARLYYISIEKFPLDTASLERALSAWPALAPLRELLVQNYPPPLPGRHRLLFDQGRVCLDLVIGDVTTALDKLAELPGLAVDAWYLDGFAPARNPEMWSTAVFDGMARLSHHSTRFATFTAAGAVRRGLQAAGFEVEKSPGFGRKREMLRGRSTAEKSATRYSGTPWHLAGRQPPGGRSAIVLGAGLAGATTAAALAGRGWQVQVLERDSVAGAASGNPQGVLYTRISHRQSELNDFSLHSYCFALRLYRRLLGNGELEAGVDGDLCGALHLQDSWAEDHPLAMTVRSLPDLVYPVDAATAAAKTGLAECRGGLFYPGAGWLHPPALCRTLLGQPGIETRENCGPVQLAREDEAWVATTGDTVLARADVAVIACGAGSRDQAGLDWLPLQSIRGQVSELPSSGSLAALKTVICHSGYLAPAREGLHCIGATFDLDTTDTTIRNADHDYNLEELQQAIPGLSADLANIEPEVLSGRVGFRCASPDYLPIAGPVPDRDAFCEDYADLRKNARRVITTTGRYLPGLYVSTAHGSRGLTSTPLTAELLAAEVNGEAWPVDTPLYRALAPARFLVRDLVRNRI